MTVCEHVLDFTAGQAFPFVNRLFDPYNKIDLANIDIYQYFSDSEVCAEFLLDGANLAIASRLLLHQEKLGIWNTQRHRFISPLITS